MPKPHQKTTKTKLGSVGISALKSSRKKHEVGVIMAGIKILTHSTPVYESINTAIIKSGLKPDPGFYKALKNYSKAYKLKGKKAETVNIYLAKTAINIAKTTVKVFSEKKGFVKSSDLKAAVYFYHLPTGVDDTCESASDTIMSLEKARPKGSVGKLTPDLIGLLDKHKI
jgi:hypothetical protein